MKSGMLICSNLGIGKTTGAFLCTFRKKLGTKLWFFELRLAHKVLTATARIDAVEMS
jgi:hypothetical protein